MAESIVPLRKEIKDSLTRYYLVMLRYLNESERFKQAPANIKVGT